MNLTSNQLRSVISRWRKILEIEPRWNIHFHIRNSPNLMSAGNEDALACIDVDLKYFVADIEFNAAEIDDEDELEGVVLHELLHIIIEPISCAATCGMGKKFDEMSSILCESTIERLMPGYLTLYGLAEKSIKKRKSAKPTNRAVRCKRGTTNN